MNEINFKNDYQSTSILSKFKEIYQRFNETDLNSALKYLMEPIETVIKKYKGRIDNICLQQIYDRTYNILSCDKALVTDEGRKDGPEAVNYIFKKMIHAANVDNIGCNSADLRQWLISNNIIIKKSLEAAFTAKKVITKHDEYFTNKQYAKDCFDKILSEIKSEIKE